MNDDHPPKGPYIVWQWDASMSAYPQSYATLDEAVKARKSSEKFLITKVVEWQAFENGKRLVQDLEEAGGIFRKLSKATGLAEWQAVPQKKEKQ